MSELPEEGQVIERETGGPPWAPVAVAALLGGSGVLGLVFAIIVLAAPDPQLEGLSLGAALACLSATLILAGKRVVPRERAIEARPRHADPEAQAEVEAELPSAADGVSRRGLIVAAGAAAGTGLAAALVAPALSLGPAVHDRPAQTPWRRGRRLVDEHGRPLTADDVPAGTFVTAFPEGADPRELGSPVVLVRVDPALLKLPPERRTWAPQGIVAYSKVCTHAGCAIALYRKPTYQPAGQQPAGLACPCHYSVFDPGRGGEPVAGPANRALPQLPLVLGPGGELRAGGGFSAPVGPSWLGVRRT